MANPNEKFLAPRRSGVLIDSNLLLLLFIGGYDRKQIQINKRLKAFAEEDFDVLVGFLSQFSQLITTPNTLTEVSNLSSGIPEREKE